MASVKVAVRVRPLNKREQDMKANVCIHMEDKKTVITNFHAPGGGEDKKDFTFDHSYWSADSSDKHFASQEQVFSDLGTDVLEAAFEGYNACIFAYGQTGSGKSYSMMGMSEAQGLIPRICKGLYSRMSSCADNKTEFRTEVSYLEIYNERVGDLLQPTKGKDFNLKVREHPKEGPYVQDLTKHHVADYEGIERLMDSGNSNRTVASTNMNDVSSRSHAIFTISFTQAKFYTDMPSETVSKIHLVDLAGSERANSTGATGDRLKEGANINKSLVTLGTVISNLADASDHDSRKDSKKKLFIPYRNSVLTWLLKDSLGGNAKTIMIAAISPADVNYSETLSTLRYANRAKNIMNKPTVNEDANVKLIRELRSEIEKLKCMLKERGEGDPDLSIGEAEKNIINEQLHQNEAKVEELTKNWTSKWRETQKIIEERGLGFRYEGAGVRMESELPHLVCIDDDVLSTGVTLYHLKDGMTYMGKEGHSGTPDIILTGPGIDGSHCIMESIDGNVIIHPLAHGCQINGENISKAKRLSQGDVVLLGKTNMFRYNHPQEAAKLRKQRYYESMESLADIPAESERAPSYLFYNAGLELERQYREETKLIEQQRLELEKQQNEAAHKLEEARIELEVLKAQQEKADQTRSQEDEERKREILENKVQLEKQKKYLEELRIEQESARKRAEDEIREVKDRIKKEQEEERKRMEAEMQRLLALEEQHRKTVHAKEQEMLRVKEELEKKWDEERKQVEQQRQEVETLQEEIENKRKEVEQVEQQMRLTTEHSSHTPSPGRLTPIRQHQEEDEGEGDSDVEEAVSEVKKSHIDILRSHMQNLEAEYEEQRKVAQLEIAEAKEAVRKAEQEALEGLRSLTTGKSAIEDQWQNLELVKAKHKGIHDTQLAKMRDLREMLDQAEEAEEAVLVEKEKIIMERRAARHKVEEVRRKLEDLEHEDKVVELTEEDFNKKKELLEWETREEIKDIREERRILNELYGKHQTALQKATQMVTETKTKLEKHLDSEKFMLVPLRSKVESLVRNELGPLIVAEQDIERRCEEVDYECRERKKLIYKQRRRIALLERQHNQALQQAEKETLNEEELEELENERDAERSLIRKEKVRLLELEKKHKEQQESDELMIGDAVKDLEKHKTQVNHTLANERKKLVDLESVHKETLEHIEHELEARTEMLHRVKDKVQKDKRQLAKLDVRQQRCAAKAAEELFLMADLLEKEMSDKGKTEELMKIREHRQKLQELDRQLRMAERKERGGRGDDDQNSCRLI